MSDDTDNIISALAGWLRQASSVAVLTGAGVSAESGVPTFRDAQTGLWARYSPEELASPQAFHRNPQLVWEWYAWRRELVSRAQPNPGHLALAELERRVPRFSLITQNVDSLHQRAGSRNVIELHGSLARTACFDDGALVETWQETGELPPRCPRCGGRLRPAVVWFGEQLPAEELWRALNATSCDLFLSVGTSGLVQPAATLPQRALERGARLIEINIELRSQLTETIARLGLPSGQALPALVRAAWPQVPTL